MKILLPSIALFLLFAASSPAQIYPNRPAGVVTSNHDVVTRFGPDFEYVLSAPTPVYPPGAMRHGVSGSGVFLVDLSLMLGTVNDVRVLSSTGSQVLDDAAKDALSKWTFRRWTIYKASIPVEFDASGRVMIGSNPNRSEYISAILGHISKVPRGKQ